MNRGDLYRLSLLLKSLRDTVAAAGNQTTKAISENTTAYEKAHEPKPAGPPERISAEVNFSQGEAHRYYSEQKNTYSTQRWTFWATLGTLVAVVAYAVITYCQLRTMNATFGEISKQTILQDTTGKAQLRAYMLFSKGHVVISNDGKITAIVEFKNSGQTPAYNVTRSISAATSNVIDTETFIATYWAKRKDPFFRFKPTGPESSDVGHDDILEFNTEAQLGSGGIVYVWGRVMYRDQFQRCQWDRFWLRTIDSIQRGKELRLGELYNVTVDKTDCGNDGKTKEDGPE
jgi:hypothetical protein